MLALFSKKVDKETTNIKGCRPFIAKKGHKDFNDNKDHNTKMNKDINTEEDEDINTEEDEDIDTEENKGYNTTSHKLTAGYKADSNIESNKSNIQAKPKQNASPINAGALTKVIKSNTVSKYIASIDKLVDLVNQSGLFKLDVPAKDHKNQKAVTLKQEKGYLLMASKMSSSGTDKKQKLRLVSN